MVCYTVDAVHVIVCNLLFMTILVVIWDDSQGDANKSVAMDITFAQPVTAVRLKKDRSVNYKYDITTYNSLRLYKCIILHSNNILMAQVCILFQILQKMNSKQT